MNSSVKEVLEDRIVALNDDISWIEADIKRSASFVESGEKRLAGVVAERNEIRDFLDETFPEPTDLILEQLKKTREVLEERGRTTNTFINENCEVCVLGAVGVAVLGEVFESDPSFYPFYSGEPKDEFEQQRRRGAASEVVQAIAGELQIPWPRTPDYGDLYIFNDRAETTDEEVFDLIDRAIETRKAAA